MVVPVAVRSAQPQQAGPARRWPFFRPATLASDVFDAAVEWDTLAVDIFSGVGKHAPINPTGVFGVAGEPLVLEAIDLLSTPRKVRVRNVSAASVNITTSWQWSFDASNFAPVASTTAVAAGAAVVLSLPAAFAPTPTDAFNLALYSDANFGSDASRMCFSSF